MKQKLYRFIEFYRFSKTEKYSVVGLIKYGKAVCSGYSLLAQYIFQSKGISVINVEGRPYNEKDETIGHRWLMINIDGDYYHYDVTWNSLLSKNLSLPQNVVFNIPTDEALKLYIFDEDYCNISSNSINHNYYNRVGKYYKDLLSISNAVSNFLKSSESYFHFKISNDLRMEDVINLIKEILENNGFKNKYKLRVELTYFAITVC